MNDLPYHFATPTPFYMYTYVLIKFTQSHKKKIHLKPEMCQQKANSPVHAIDRIVVKVTILTHLAAYNCNTWYYHLHSVLSRVRMC